MIPPFERYFEWLWLDISSVFHVSIIKDWPMPSALMDADSNAFLR